MKTNGQKRGSVLMEFIIVFPIYLILFAGTVAIGDMLIHSNRLVPADRVAAYRVDGRESLAWQLIAEMVFHPGVEIADDGTNQDGISTSTEAHYADATGPWSVCALASANDTYKLLAGGTLGQLLSVRLLVGGGETGVLDQLVGSGVGMVSKDTRNGASFYTLKRRDHYYQRQMEREGSNKYIRPDVRNWRDRNYVSYLLKNKYWRSEVANEGWHSSATINGGEYYQPSDAPTDRANIPAYERHLEFVYLSE